jgi:acetyl esterase/lipase
MKMDRRALLGIALSTGLAAALPRRAFADDMPASADGRVPGDPTEIVPLWPGMAPGGTGVDLPPYRVNMRTSPALPLADRSISQVGRPQLDVFRPERSDGSALIIAPGGGYAREAFDLEGTDVARHYVTLGVTCFVLRYRLPGEGWKNRELVPLQDAQRAMRLVRNDAAKYGVDPARIGFIGFSAGGHLAASIATKFDMAAYAPIDGADTVSARPDFSVPMYPVITMGEGCHAGSRDRLLGETPSPEPLDAWSLERHVAPNTPPTFLALAADDATVPPLPNAGAYYVALQAAKIPSEIHLFESGGHGFGIAHTLGKPNAAWPDLLSQWGRSHGFFKG